MTLTFEIHVASFTDRLNASTNFEVIGCNSFQKIIYTLSH